MDSINRDEQGEQSDDTRFAKQSYLDKVRLFCPDVVQWDKEVGGDGVSSADRKGHIHGQSEPLVYGGYRSEDALSREVERALEVPQAKNKRCVTFLSRWYLSRLCSIEYAYARKGYIKGTENIGYRARAIWTRVQYNGYIAVNAMSVGALKSLLALLKQTEGISKLRKEASNPTIAIVNVFDIEQREQYLKKFEAIGLMGTQAEAAFIKTSIYITYTKELQWFRHFNMTSQGHSPSPKGKGLVGVSLKNAKTLPSPWNSTTAS